MVPPRFYHPVLALGDAELSPVEARHAAGARRLRAGDAVTLFDGRGSEADARLVRVASGTIVVHVDAVRAMPPAAVCALTLAVSPPKQARQDDLIEKCTELGVRAVWPLRAERSVAEAAAGRLERWRRVSIAAAKQSQQAWLPEIREAATLAEVLTAAGAFERIVLADPSPDAPALSAWLDQHPGVGSILALIGPEGGFTDAERSVAIAAGAAPCRLTPTILRVETAAIALASVVLCRPMVRDVPQGSRTRSVPGRDSGWTVAP